MIKRILNYFGKTGRSLRLALVFLIASVFALGQTTGNEYSIKAMFVLNFMKYIEWPSEANQGNFKIGVVGDPDIYHALINMTTNRQENKKFKIERTLPETTGKYQIIIISKSENKHIEEITKRFHGKGVLIISDECKTNCDAAINLLSIDNKTRFEINLSQAKLCGIKISSRLADLAVTVHP